MISGAYQAVEIEVDGGCGMGVWSSDVWVGAFVAEEGAALLCISIAVHLHVEARQGPWGLWDIVPIFAFVVLVFFYLPVLFLESAAHPGLDDKESSQAAVEGALLQAGAILVGAFTGTNPWI